jgi:hypothetical protein
MSNEMFSMVKGKKADKHLHDPILNNPKADKKIAAEAIARAVKRGMSSVRAKELYGVKSDGDV